MSASRSYQRLGVPLLLLLVVSMMLVFAASASADPVTGAIWTTDSTGTKVNANIYADKQDVYLNGGPLNKNDGPLQPGEYYVQITDPSGATVLGTSIGTADETPFVVTADGVSAQLYQLWAILIKGSDGTQGYDDTPNPGGEYKVWISTDPAFANQYTKTDNFKVRSNGGGGGGGYATLRVVKYYDANVNGIFDAGELELTGWKVRVTGPTETQPYDIDDDFYTPTGTLVLPGTYDVSEYFPVEPNWIATTPTTQTVTLAAGEDKTVYFGNVSLGAGGGLTLGFWSNRNGQALIDSTDLALLTALNLRSATGADFDPASYAAFRTWILGATATNMAYMLSAQLAAMELNVYNGKVNGSSLIYAPGTNSANAAGFATVNAVMAEANTELGLHGLTTDGSPYRSYQEALKNALDKANNNLTFVQATPGPYTFL